MTATTAVQADYRELLLRACAAYNSQDIEALVALVSDDVNWPYDDAGRLRSPWRRARLAAGHAALGRRARLRPLHNFRRLRTRYERDPKIHQAFLTLACAVMCSRRLNSLRNSFLASARHDRRRTNGGWD